MPLLYCTLFQIEVRVVSKYISASIKILSSPLPLIYWPKHRKKFFCKWNERICNIISEKSRQEIWICLASKYINISHERTAISLLRDWHMLINFFIAVSTTFRVVGGKSTRGQNQTIALGKFSDDRCWSSSPSRSSVGGGSQKIGFIYLILHSPQDP